MYSAKRKLVACFMFLVFILIITCSMWFTSAGHKTTPRAIEKTSEDNMVSSISKNTPKEPSKIIQSIDETDDAIDSETETLLKEIQQEQEENDHENGYEEENSESNYWKSLLLSRTKGTFSIKSIIETVKSPNLKRIMKLESFDSYKARINKMKYSNDTSAEQTTQKSVGGYYTYIPYTKIPKFIHRVYMNTKSPDNSENLMNIVQRQSFDDFQHKNEDGHQFVWSLDDAHEFVDLFYPMHAELFKTLPKFIFKADLFRYMVLAVFGGVYSDLDTFVLTPIDEWAKFYLEGLDLLPHQTTNNENISFTKEENLIPPVTAMVGLEVKANATLIPQWHDYWPRDIQICQWTIVSGPGTNMINTIVTSMLGHTLAIPQSKLSNYDVLELAGPGIWTDIILDWSRQRGVPKSEFFKIQETARKIEDTLILPIYAFSPGPLGETHAKMGVIDAGSPGTLVKHKFQGTWRGH